MNGTSQDPPDPGSREPLERDPPRAGPASAGADVEERTITTTALLAALGAGDGEAWSRFDRRWRPVLFRLAGRLGLADEDAADVAQDTLLEFFRDYGRGRYDRERGRLRSWLLAIARNRARDRGRSAARVRGERGDSLLELLEEPHASELEDIWEREVQDEVLRRAFEALRASSETDERTLAVFEDYVLHGRPPEEVAARHGIAPATVYVAKSRCLARLAKLRGELAAVYDA